MKVADYLYYSQHSLSSFQTCPMKFKKRYIDNLKWQGFLSDRIKRKIELGNAFHLCAYRYFSNIPITDIEDVETLEKVTKLKEKFVIGEERKYYPEYKMRMVDSFYKIEANIDLLIVNEDNSVEIWDWKTGNANEDKLRNSFQTILYMFIVYEQAERLLGVKLKAEDLSMSYWLLDKNVPDVKIYYSDDMHEQFRKKIANSINEIENFDIKDFEKDKYINSCKFCEYNWYCETGEEKNIDFDESFDDILNWDDDEDDF